mgnify:CR=1 FL=1
MPSLLSVRQREALRTSWAFIAPYRGRVVGALLALMFLFGGLSFAIYPIAVAQLIDQLHSDEILSGSSSLLMVNGVGSVCGPLLAGLLMQYSGAAALPLYFAATLGLLAAYTFYRLRHVSDLVAGEQAHFVPMLRTSHTVLELMPDAPPSADDIDSDNDQTGDEREPVTTSS